MAALTGASGSNLQPKTTKQQPSFKDLAVSQVRELHKKIVISSILKATLKMKSQTPCYICSKQQEKKKNRKGH